LLERVEHGEKILVTRLLHRMGRETDQGEVAFEFDDRSYRIRQFDSL
jgi:hypothetical protein